jgi:hypothetical protein
VAANATDDVISNGRPLASSGRSISARWLQKKNTPSLLAVDEMNESGNSRPNFSVICDRCLFAALRHSVQR